MTSTDTPIKTTLAERIADRLAGLLPIKDHSQVVRVDATAAHSYEYLGKGRVVAVNNPERQKAIEAKGRELRDARDARINGAGAVRDQKRADAKARYDAEIKAIEAEHASSATVAYAEYASGEQAMLALFAMPPADVAKVEG